MTSPIWFCFRRVAMFAVVNCFCLSLALSAPVDSKRAELKDIQGRLGTLKKDLAKSEASKIDTAAQLRNIESTISVANRKLRELGEKRSAVQAQLNELERQSKLLAGQVDNQQKQLSRLLYQQFVHGDNDALHLLLSGENPNQSARDRYFLTRLSQQKADLLGDMRVTLKEKKRLTDAARDKAEELSAIEKQQQQEHAALLTQQKQRQTLLAQIGSRIKSQQQEIATLKANEKRLGSLIDRLARQSIQRKSKRSRTTTTTAPTPQRGKTERGPDLSHVSGEFAALRGKLRLPVRGEIAGRFGSPHGENATTWKGLFIRAADGSDVHAVAEGTVVYSDWLRGFGNLVIIDHGDGFLSVYGNNQSLLRTAGSEVKTGETIAAVGNSGGNEESGLYFELRHKGQPFDPLRWVSLK